MRMVLEAVEAVGAGLTDCLGQTFNQRDFSKLPRICYLGKSRAGKDEAAAFLSTVTNMRYAGSASLMAAPMIAYSLGMSTEEAFKTRHQYKEFWYEWLILFKKFFGPTCLVEMLLSKADIVVGLRRLDEVKTAWEKNLITHLVWIDRPANAKLADTTINFDWPDVQRMSGMRIINDSYLADFHNRVRSHATMAGCDVLD